MKKSIWIILPIVIIAVVLVAVFAGQRNSLSDQVNTLETANQDLTRQLSEADMAAKTAQELAENDIAAAKQAAEDAQEALAAVTTERDTLQAKSDAAAAQLNDSIRQAQIALDALVGEEASPEKELAAAKEELAAAQEELEAMKAELAASQEAAALAVTLQNDLDSAKAELAAQQESVQAQIDEAVAAALAEVKTEKMAVEISREDETVLVLDNLGDLADAELENGAYTLTITILDAEGTEIAQYAFPYMVAGEAPAAEEVEEENVPAQEPAEATEEQPAEAEAEAVEPVDEDAEQPAEEASADEESASADATEEALEEEPVKETAEETQEAA